MNHFYIFDKKFQLLYYNNMDPYCQYLFGWDGWIRTSEMTESKSVALPLGYTPSKGNFVINSTRSTTLPRVLVLKMGWIIGFEPTASRATI
jgi:hypothetical protein